jgi:hypothetical protein
MATLIKKAAVQEVTSLVIRYSLLRRKFTMVGLIFNRQTFGTVVHKQSNR